MSYVRSDNTDSRWLLVDNLHNAVKDVLPEDLIVGGIEVVTGVWIVGAWRGDFYHRGIFQTEEEAQEAAYSHETVSYVPWGADTHRVFGRAGQEDGFDYSNVGEVSTCVGYGPQYEELLQPDDGGGADLMGLREKPEPAFKFSNDDGTKLYRSTDDIGFTTSGTVIREMSSFGCDSRDIDECSCMAASRAAQEVTK